MLLIMWFLVLAPLFQIVGYIIYNILGIQKYDNHPDNHQFIYSLLNFLISSTDYAVVFIYLRFGFSFVNIEISMDQKITTTNAVMDKIVQV